MTNGSTPIGIIYISDEKRIKMTILHYIKKGLCVWATGWLMMSCGGHPSVPDSSTPSGHEAHIYPDYTDVTVPCNIAPLNFMLTDSLATECVARFTAGDGSVQTYGDGIKVIVPEDEWKQMLQASVGKDIKVETFAKVGDKWLSDNAFAIHVSKDEIDPYVSYRLIQPSYEMYDKMYIMQRNVTNFDEVEVFNNKIACDDKKGQCINCHSYQNYRTDNMLFHVRVTRGGTMMVKDGKVCKVDLKREGMISAGVYPSWHPTLPLVAFSTNTTRQYFHTDSANKVEVFDNASDLVLYDVNADKVTNICADTTRLEVFPTWAPDGKCLYYCMADVQKPDSAEEHSDDIRFNYKKLHYNLYRRSFDATSKTFGNEELVYRADTLERSVSLPRISPDGRFVAFAEGGYGCFNIWHHDADIRLMQISNGTFIPAKALNSAEYADSYPSFSSNGRWVMCASRRDDGNYSRIYIAYFDGKQLHKAFLLPQADPEQNTLRLFSYNRPEYTVEPVKVSLQTFASEMMKEH